MIVGFNFIYFESIYERFRELQKLSYPIYLSRYLENDYDDLECSAREEYSQYTEKDWKTISGKLETIKKRLEQAQNKYKSKEKLGKKP